jgi:hypothetical protein
MYDLGLSFLWLSFVVSGVIGGGIATILKKQFGIDIRGRGLEGMVVIMTLWLASVCWGLVWAFFGNTEECKGSFSLIFQPDTPSTPNSFHDGIQSYQAVVVSLTRSLILEPAKKSLVRIDNLFLKLGPVFTKWICHSGNYTSYGESDHEKYCFELTRKANPEFLMTTDNSKCSSDISTVATIWTFAIGLQLISYAMRRVERFRRAVLLAGRHPRPHQD